MKNIFKSSLLLLGALTLFTGCKDDNGSNPTLVEPASFVLNTPAYAQQVIELRESSELHFTWNQPDYGFPAAVDYALQVSLDGNFTVPVELAEADESGETVADYATVELTDEDRDLKGFALVSEVATGLQKLGKWESANVPAEQDVHCRVVANTTGAAPVYSNVVTIKVAPYYVELKDTPIGIWFITGAFTPDGGWKNNADGSNMLAMLPVPGADVDKKTGETILEWAGYIPAGGEFKIIAPAGLQNWNYGLCGGDESGGQVYRDGGDDPGNIKYTAGGWVKLTLDTKAKTLTFTAINGEPTAMTQIAMPGSYQPGDGWDVNSNLLTAAAMSDAHDWTGEVTFESDCKFKFAANGAWDINWGSNTFPIGAGTQNGSDIPGTAGTYKVYFNDILGYYYLVAQ